MNYIILGGIQGKNYYLDFEQSLDYHHCFFK